MGACTELSQQISARVRAAIQSSEHPSWVEVAEIAGIPRETLRRRLNDTNPFTTDELEAVAIALGLPPDAFLNSARWTAAS